MKKFIVFISVWAMLCVDSAWAWDALAPGTQASNRASIQSPEDISRIRATDSDKIRVAALQEAHRAQFGKESSIVALAPGRANLIGEHVDYPPFPEDSSAENFSLPFALQFNLLVAASRSSEEGSDLVRLYSMDYREGYEFRLSELERLAGDGEFIRTLRQEHNWVAYIMGLFYAAKRRGYILSGGEFTIQGNVPIGSGVSASAAYMVAMTLACKELFGWPLTDRSEIAKMAREGEHIDFNPFVGSRCGLLDQTASLEGARDTAVLINYGRLRDIKKMRFDLKGYQIVLVDSRAPRNLAETEYSTRVDELHGVPPMMNRLLGTNKTHVSAFTLEEFKRIEREFEKEAPVLYKRARHVLTERQRTLDFYNALLKGDLERAGRLLNESGDSLSMKGDFEISGRVSVPGRGYLNVQDILLEIGRSYGAYGRMMGGGGGGCAIFLLEKGKAEAWKEKVKETYQTKTGLEPEFYDAVPSEGARIVWREDSQRRAELIALTRDWQSFQGTTRREKRLKELQALAMEILGIQHIHQFKPTTPTRVVIAASGIGMRMKEVWSGPKTLYPLNDEPILLHILRVLTVFDEQPLIVVKAGERFSEREGEPGRWDLANETIPDKDPYERIKEVVDANGFSATFLGQKELWGEGHAVLQTERLLRNFDGHLIVTWGDMALLNGETVLTLLMVKEAADKLGLDVPFIIGTAIKENPYAPIIRGPNSNVIGSQKGLKLDYGEDDTGIFVGDAQDIFTALRAYPYVQEGGRPIYLNPYNMERNRNGEMNLVQISAIFAKGGREAMALPVARRAEARGINNSEDVEHALEHRSQIEMEAVIKIRRAGNIIELADILTVEPLTNKVASAVLEWIRQNHPEDAEGQNTALETIVEEVRGFGNGARASQFLQQIGTQVEFSKKTEASL